MSAETTVSTLAPAASPLEALAYSSVLAGVTGACLAAACASGLGAEVSPFAAAVIFCGSVGVYSLDRLRDRRRDFRHAPRRSEFVARHEEKLRVLCGLAFVLACGLTLWVGIEQSLGLVPVAALGFFHRRLKAWPFLKALYVALAWTVALLVVSYATGSSLEFWPGVSLVLLLSIFANTSVSGAGGVNARRWPALGAALLAVLVAGTADPPLTYLLPVPISAALAALAGLRSEWSRAVIPDGALACGAFAAWLLA